MLVEAKPGLEVISSRNSQFLLLKAFIVCDNSLHMNSDATETHLDGSTGTEQILCVWSSPWRRRNNTAIIKC